MNLPKFSVQNPIAANLLMVAILAGGTYFWMTMVREFFPPLEPEKLFISVAYPGASPLEVEKNVTKPIEEEVKNLSNIEKITSRILEGATSVELSLSPGANRNKILNDVRAAVDRLKPRLPKDAQDPEISEQRPFVPVIAVVLFGNVSENSLKTEAKRLKDYLTSFPDISEIHIAGVRRKEIWIEVPPKSLAKHHLSFAEMAKAIERSNLDLPGGQISTPLGNIRIRTKGEKNLAYQLENIIVQAGPKGENLRLLSLAKVRQTFEDKVEKGRFQKKRAAILTIFKTPEQDALRIAKIVKNYVKQHPPLHGGAISLAYITDLSRFIQQRLELMTRNAKMGLILVLASLALFLHWRLAFWVAMGIPVSFMGTFIVMHLMGESINLISLFALIVVLGMIVDDAIVVGENVYTKMEQGLPPKNAAIHGALEVVLPVCAATLTTIAAFAPLLFVEGRIGTLMGILPKIVIAALLVSLLEAFLILPAHLGHIPNPSHKPQKKSQSNPWKKIIQPLQQIKFYLLQHLLPQTFTKILSLTLKWRYVTLALSLAFSLLVLGLVASQKVPFVFVQKMDSENISINLEMSVGTPVEITEATIKKMENIISRFPEVKHIFSVVGSTFTRGGRKSAADPATVGQINLELYPGPQRQAKKQRNSQQLILDMRAAMAHLPQVKNIQFHAAHGGPGGEDIQILVQSENLHTLVQAVEFVRQTIQKYDAISNVEDNMNMGKRELHFSLKEKGHFLGLTTNELASQIRYALHGVEVQKLQREDEEVQVRLLLPKNNKHHLKHLLLLPIKTPNGELVPLQEVAEIQSVRGYGALYRIDGKRAYTIIAEVNENKGNVAQITEDLVKKLSIVPQKFPGVSLQFEGKRKETKKSLASLKTGFLAALLLIYCILAVLFRSYIHPVIIMLVIPYSFIGSILGHYLMGFPFTIISMIGCVALAGIVVNDSLILVDFINRLRRKSTNLHHAILQGAQSRLRPILLTSITTILGLAPLMLEKSFQAQFLIPMAISLVFGLSLATILVLILIPAFYHILEDLLATWNWIWNGKWCYQEIHEEIKNET
ncbi:MAG: efflux RND transporter permease subunit [Planctomycetota bacterium]|nr:MAG: efflux RND transporter permease subunit [Planctomycetota bacterium]